MLRFCSNLTKIQQILNNLPKILLNSFKSLLNDVIFASFVLMPCPKTFNAIAYDVLSLLVFFSQQLLTIRITSPSLNSEARLPFFFIQTPSFCFQVEAAAMRE